MKKLYLVIGECGEYDCLEWWPVIAYDNKSIADFHVELADEKAEKIYKACLENIILGNGYLFETIGTHIVGNEYDPDMMVSLRSPSSYSVRVVKLQDEEVKPCALK